MSDELLVNAAYEQNLLDHNTITLRQIIHGALLDKHLYFDAGIGMGFALWRIEFGGIAYRLELTPHSAADQDISKPS